jgi:hypothetical protein
VESLANPASTLTEEVSIGKVDSQFSNKSVERSLGLMFSLIRILRSSLGYSETWLREVRESSAGSPSKLCNRGIPEDEDPRDFTLDIIILRGKLCS